MISRFTQAPALLKLLVGAGIVVAFLAVVIWVPKLSFVQPGGLTNSVDRAKAESDLRGHLLQALAGLVVIVTVYFTARTFVLNREGQITERFTRAVEQLGNDDKIDIRLGGIYALERIAHDSETHYEPVMEVLTAFLREHSPWPPRSAPKSDSPPEQTVDKGSKPADDEPRVPALRVDFQAVATVLGRRDRRHQRPRYSLDLTRVNLREATLYEANLSEDDLSVANLSGAILIGADLSEADLIGADLSGAYLSRAHLNGADLSGADLRGADLSGADLSGAILYGAYLSEANLSGADLSGADLTGADLSGANLSGADLSAVIRLTQEQLDQAIYVKDTIKLPEYLGGEQSDVEDDEDG